MSGPVEMSIIARDQLARAGVLTTPHGEVNTPVVVEEGGRSREGLRFQTKIPFEDPDLVRRIRERQMVSQR